MATLAPDQVHTRSRGHAPQTPRPTAVVGHDGSAGAAALLAHAGRRVGRDGYLIVVHALPLGVSAAAYANAARGVLRSIEAAIPEGISYEARVVEGPASRALLDTADRCGADEIVLGASAGRAARGGVGRVAGTVLGRSEVPVTIVPRRAV